MHPVTIIRHIQCEGPGYLETVLSRHQIRHEIIALDQQEPLPADLGNSSGLVIMGGPMSVNDDADWIRQEIQLVRQAIEANLPVLGHCLGGQFIARALGASVGVNPAREIGWFPVEATSNTALVPAWLNRFTSPQPVFHWHGETFDIPDGALRILSSEHCNNQAFIYKDNVFAFQCHIEMTCEMVDEWSSLYTEEIAQPTAATQTREEMLEHCQTLVKGMNDLADDIYSDWINKLEH